MDKARSPSSKHEQQPVHHTRRKNYAPSGLGKTPEHQHCSDAVSIESVAHRSRSDSRTKAMSARNQDGSFPREHEPVDIFWKAWQQNGETGKHGVYESTWIAFDAVFAWLSEQTWQALNAQTAKDIPQLLDEPDDYWACTVCWRVTHKSKKLCSNRSCPTRNT